MRTAWPTTRAAFTRLKVFDGALDSAAARCFLFGRDDPTNPFVPRERRQILPSRLRRFRAERHAQVHRSFVHGPELVRFALVHHFIRPTAAKKLALTSRTTPNGEVEGPHRSARGAHPQACHGPLQRLLERMQALQIRIVLHGPVSIRECGAECVKGGNNALVGACVTETVPCERFRFAKSP